VGRNLSVVLSCTGIMSILAGVFIMPPEGDNPTSSLHIILILAGAIVLLGSAILRLIADIREIDRDR